MIKSSTIYRTILIVAICFFSITVFTNSSNPPAANAGDPGAGNCTSCHSGTAITSGTAWSSIALSGLPANGYVPGTVYTLTINGGTAATSKNGFQLTSLNASNAMAGAIAAGTGTATSTSSGKTYVSQSGNNGASWSFNWTAPTSGTGTVTFYAAYNGSNSGGSNSGDAIYLKTFTLSQAVTNLPTAVITPSSTTICLGDTLYLAGSGINNPTAFSWQFLNNTPNTGTGQNVFIVYNTIGNRQVKLTTSNADGNSLVATTTISVVAKPSAAITTPNGLTICGNDSILLQANTVAGLQYLWTPGNFTTSAIKVADSIAYKVKVTNVSNGCFANSALVKPTKASIPQSILTSSKDTICKTDSVMFDLSGSGFSAQYLVNDTVVQTSTDPLFKFKRNTEGIYKITAKITKNGCSNTLPNKLITVLEKAAAPTVLCGNSTSSTLSFNWQQVFGFSNYEVSTNNGNSWNDANGLNQLSHTVSGLQPNSTVNIMVRAKAIGPCGAGFEASKSCVNNGCNPLNITYSFRKNICINSLDTTATTNIELKTISNPKYLIQYEFGNNVAAYSRNTLYAFNAKLGNNLVRIKVKDTSDNLCPIVDSTFIIKGNSSPIKPILSTNNMNGNYCKGNDILVTAAKGANSHHLLIIQTFPTTKSLNESFLLNTFNLKNKFSTVNNKILVIATDTATLCADSSNETTINESPNPTANFSFEYFKSDTNNVNKNKVLFTNLSSDTASSLWLFGDLSNSTSQLTNASFTYNKGGNYTVKLITKNTANCIDTSSKQITITNTSISSLLASSFIKIYPNPVKDFITIELLKNIANAQITILDLSGKQLYQQGLNQIQAIPTNHFNAGIYLLKIEMNNKTYYTKFIKN
jgi:PKD repeat protein